MTDRKSHSSYSSSVSGGPEEIARFLRNYHVPPNALHNLHNLQVSSEAFSLQPAEILRVIGFLDEVEIHAIANDWREYRAKGYSPSYIDRLLLAEFHRSSAEDPPARNLDNTEDQDIIEPSSTSLLDLSSSLLLSPSPVSVISTPSSKTTHATSPSNNDINNRNMPTTNSKTVTFASNLEMAAPITPCSPKSAQSKSERVDLVDVIQELRTLVEQRSVENDYLRLQYNSQVEDVERRAKEYKEIHDECKEWKKAKQALNTQLLQTEAARSYLQTELDDTLKIMTEKNLLLFNLQEELRRCQLQIQTLQEKVQLKPRQSDAMIQCDPSVQQSLWSIVSSDIISIDPEPNLVLASMYNQHSFVNGSEISTINEDDDRLMSGESITGEEDKHAITPDTAIDNNSIQSEDKIPTMGKRIAAVIETIDIGIITDSISITKKDQETDTCGLHNEEDIVATSSRITVSKNSKTNTVDDPWSNLSFVELLQKYRTLEEESTAWQHKQYQDLIDAESEVRRLEMLLSEKEKDCLSFQDKYDRLLRSSMSEINKTALQEKAESAELIATLQGQREGHLGKIIQLQELLEQKETIIAEKDTELVRLQSLLRNGRERETKESPLLDNKCTCVKEEKDPINSRLPANITEGRSISLPLVASSNAVKYITEKNKENKINGEKVEENEEGIDMVESRGRESQERHHWEEKERLYLIHIDYLSASLRELTAAFHQQQNILQKIAPISESNYDYFSFDVNKAATVSSDPQRTKSKPTPPSISQQQQQNNRPKTSHGYVPTTAATSRNVRSTSFPHRHRAIKSAPRRDPTSLASPSIVEDTSRKHVQNNNNQRHSPKRDEKLFYSDNEPSVNGNNSENDGVNEDVEDEHVMFFKQIDHDRSISPLTVNEQDRKKLEKEQKDALLKQAYDPESLRQIYFHHVNKNPRPLTGNLYSAIQKNQQASAPNKSRPASSSSAHRSKDTRKSNRPRPRSSLVANFIQGLEMRYNEDLARLIHDQQEEDATFYDQLATSVGKIARDNAGRQLARTEGADQEGSQGNSTSKNIVYGSSSHSNKSDYGNNSHNSAQKVSSGPENGPEVNDIRGSHGGGFFVTVVPSLSMDPQTARVVPKLPLHQRSNTEANNANSGDLNSSSSNNNDCNGRGAGNDRNRNENIVHIKANEQILQANSASHMQMSRNNNQPQYIPHQQPHNHYRQYSSSSAPATIVSLPSKRPIAQDRGEYMHDTEPLTSYPMSTAQYRRMPSDSSVASSTVFSSQLPSQFSSPSMVLHPSQSQPQEEFFAQYFHHGHTKRW